MVANLDGGIDNKGDVTMKAGAGLGGYSTGGGYLNFLEVTDDGTNYSQFIARAQSANITYTLPTAVPTTSGTKLTATTAGVMRWVDELADRQL